MTTLEKNVEKILKTSRADMSWVVRPRSAETFWKVIQELNIKFIVDLHPETCVYHNSGPVWKQQLNDLVQSLATNPSNRIELEKKIGNKREQLKNYERHLKQYEAEWTFLVVLFFL
jgi:hypothetical protein